MSNDKEREAAWERWNKMDSLHVGFTSKKDFDAGYCAALAHSEESVDSVTVPRSEWEAMKRDAERLDGRSIRLTNHDEDGDVHLVTYRGIDLRAAIDAAIKSTGEDV